MRAQLLIVLLLVVTLAGCFGGGDLSAEDHGDDGTEVDLLRATGCDRPLLDERVRMREIDAATNPNDASEIALGMISTAPNVRDQAPNDLQAWDALARSYDGGQTWDFAMLPGWPGSSDTKLTPLHGASVISDPDVIFLEDGTLLYSGLSIHDAGVDLFVARYAPGEMTPESIHIVARGIVRGPSPTEQVPTPFPVAHTEKQQVAQDPETGDVYMAWEQRQAAGSVPVLSRSEDGGRTWTSPVDVMGAGQISSEGTHWMPEVFVSVDGRVHVVWSRSVPDTLFQATSEDGGETFSPYREVADLGDSGEVTNGAQTFTTPYAVVDRTGGPRHGHIYVTYYAQTFGDGDAFLLVSQDNGTTWSDPIRVPDDESGNGNDQFHPDVTVEPDGAVSLLYMDRREGDGWTYKAHLARSTDGGASWTYHVLAAESSDPRNITNDIATDPLARTRLGDFEAVTVTPNGVLAAWQDGRDGTRDVPYSTAWICTLETRGPAS